MHNDRMETAPVIQRIWEADVRRPLPSVPSTTGDAGAPEERDFRARETTRCVAAVAALAVGLHLPLRGGSRYPSRWVATVTLFAGAVGLLSHRRWSVGAILSSCALAWGTMLARPLRFDPLASAAVATAALAALDLRRVRHSDARDGQ